MKIAVLGLWHLGCVTAACTARHFAVAGLDPDASNVGNLRKETLQWGQADLIEVRLPVPSVTSIRSA